MRVQEQTLFGAYIALGQQVFLFEMLQHTLAALMLQLLSTLLEKLFFSAEEEVEEVVGSEVQLC
jgi:hypothetical protein